MKLLKRAALLVAALAMTCAPAMAQNLAKLPAAAALTGPEPIATLQGSGCATNVAPCATVKTTPSQLATYLAPTFQVSDADLTAIAALATQSFGRTLLTAADAAAVRSAIGLGTAAVQTIGTSGATVPLLSGTNTFSGSQTMAGLFVGAGITTGSAVSTGETAIELGGGRTGSGVSYIDMHTTAGSDYEVRILRDAGANGNLGIQNSGSGAVNIGSGTGVGLFVNGTNMLSVNGSGATVSGVLILPTSVTPATSTATCTKGQHAWDANYYYVCIATNSWKRATLTSW